jgi:Methyltransferase domain
VIKPYIVGNGYRSLCEIGAKLGENTDELLKLDSVQIDIIDPCLDVDLSQKYRDNPRIKVHKGISLDVLPSLTDKFDCILIDGDHNWYTVYNELNTIKERALLKAEGTIFFHDVGWPYGRRDMYYQPELIPKDFTHPYKREGMIRGQSALDSSGKHGRFFNAEHEGGDKNGVLRAIEDFLKENKDEFKFFYFEEEHGLGVLLKTRSSIANVTFHKYLLRAAFNKYLLGAAYLSAAGRLKNVVRQRFPALYSSLRELRTRR